MSWFGEQFGKLTDFTKEVLIEGSGILSTAEAVQDAPVPLEKSEDYSPETLLQLLGEKDSAIEQLTKERELYDRNIEQLDEQHQEEVNQLLQQRSRLVEENHELKEKLDLLEANQDYLPSTDPLSDSVLQDAIHSSVLSKPENICIELGDKNNFNPDYDKVNLFNIFCSLKSCSNAEPLKEILLCLKDKRQSLTQLLQQNQLQEKDEYIQRTTEKINNYINYLTFASSNDEVFLPVIKESGFLLHLLHSKNVSLEENIDILRREIVDLKGAIQNLNEKEAAKGDSLVTAPCTQCTSAEIQKGTLDVAVNTVNSTVEAKQSQTNSLADLPDCRNCTCHKETISKLQSDVDSFTQKINFLQQEAICAHHNSQNNCCSISVQTEVDHDCTYDSSESELKEQRMKAKELQTLVNEKEVFYTLQLQNELSRYNDLLKEFKKKDKLLEDKEQNIANKNNEIAMLKSRISELKEKINSVNVKECDNSFIRSSKCDYEKAGFSLNVRSDCVQEKNMLNDNCISLLTKTNESNYSELEKDFKLHEQLKRVELEKGRILCVLNEKTQECSSLKSEVHRLTAVVASEKQALLKLQQDNHELKRIQQDNLDPELTKEALQNLSRIIRDKDIEVEALRQKNDTLSSLIQEPSSFSSEHLQSVMEECENLTKQLNCCKTEREKYMIRCNSKEQECQKYLTEVQRLTSLLSCQSEKFDVLQQQHHSVAQQYEEKRKSLINTQNEMIALKQRVTDLEQQQVEIKEKYSELLNKINSDVLIQVHRDEYNNKLSEIENLKISLKEKDDLIHEKDCIIHELSQQMKKQKASLEEQEQVYSDLRRENVEVLTKLNGAESHVQKLQEEKETLNQRLNDKHAELGLQKEMGERLNMTINEKEFSIQSMAKKITSLSQIVQGNVSSPESPCSRDIDQILAESDLMYSKAEHFQRERDESLLSLSQSQHENQELKNEIQKLKSTEDHLKSELDRLRQHLLQIEENYTNEALRAEEREKELRNQLTERESRSRSKNSAVNDASLEANIQISSLQEQLGMIANQRDRALAQVSALEDKVQQYVASVNNLQLVLEQMGKGYEQKLSQVEKKLLSELEMEKERCKRLQEELKAKQVQLNESSQALEAATRLSEQLDSKEEVITILRCELQKAETKVRSTSEQIESIKNNTEGKVDRVVIKSLVLGYFSTPPGQKSEVVRLLARVLDFNQEEMEKAGIIVTRSQHVTQHRGLFSSLFGRLPSFAPSTQPGSEQKQQAPEKSFTSLFVQFLETESQPINPIPLPAEKMAIEVTSKKSHSPKTQLSANAPLLLNLASSFPTFTPVPVSDSGSPAPSILKEVLK